MENTFLNELDYIIECKTIGKCKNTTLLSYIEKLDFTWHPLGFVNILLHQDQNTRYRIHIWLKNLRLGKEPNLPIHNHIFKLKSKIMMGTLQNIEYKIVRGSNYNLNIVSYDADNASSVKTTVSTSNIEIMTDKTYSAGDSYTVERNIFHQSIVKIDTNAVTFTKMIDFSRGDKPIVLSPSNINFNFSEFKSTNVDKSIRDLCFKLIKDSLDNIS